MQQAWPDLAEDGDRVSSGFSGCLSPKMLEARHGHWPGCRKTKRTLDHGNLSPTSCPASLPHGPCSGRQLAHQSFNSDFCPPERAGRQALYWCFQVMPSGKSSPLLRIQQDRQRAWGTSRGCTVRPFCDLETPSCKATTQQQSRQCEQSPFIVCITCQFPQRLC